MLDAAIAHRNLMSVAENIVHDCAEGVEVDCLPVAGSLRELRRHKLRSAMQTEHAGLRIEQPRGTEIGEHDSAARGGGGDEDILGLQVTVYNPLCMQVVQRV